IDPLELIEYASNTFLNSNNSCVSIDNNSNTNSNNDYNISDFGSSRDGANNINKGNNDDGDNNDGDNYNDNVNDKDTQNNNSNNGDSINNDNNNNTSLHKYKGFKIGHLNIQSLRNKVDLLKAFLYDCKFDIFSISETWLNGNIEDNEILIDGFKICRLDRQLKPGGGVLFYIRDGLNFKEISEFKINGIEAHWIKVNLPHTKPLLIGTVYRPPNSDAEYLNQLDTVFQNFTSMYEDVVILGDFNLDITKKTNKQKISNLAKHSNLHQLIKDYTRITNISKTIIDLIYVSNLNNSTAGVKSLGISDHSLTYLIRNTIKIKIPPKIIKVRSFKNFNENEYINDLKKTKWTQIKLCSDVESAWSIWKHLFSTI
ncbi:GATA zinc finger domain-containing protein 15-like, partial [Anneissia japonica]|uniref:GATA zinc finger domain-containing protein 15-like n=1 Tax=Anneissia japonica TaxID=1529436 RepID=UPI0014258425